MPNAIITDTSHGVVLSDEQAKLVHQTLTKVMESKPDPETYRLAQSVLYALDLDEYELAREQAWNVYRENSPEALFTPSIKAAFTYAYDYSYDVAYTAAQAEHATGKQN